MLTERSAFGHDAAPGEVFPCMAEPVDAAIGEASS